MSRRCSATSPVAPAATGCPIVVDDRDTVPGVGPAHAAGACGPFLVRVADDVVHLGLAEHLVDRHAERGAAPVEHGLTHRFAGAHHRAQAQVIAAARCVDRLHHHLQRGREQERVGHAITLHQLECAIGRETAAGADDRKPEVQRRQQRVHQATRPRPVGRGPEHVARLRKPVLRGHEPRQIADQCRVRHQRALRRAGRSAGVDQQGRIARARDDCLEPVRRGCQQRAPVPRGRCDLVDDDQVLQVRASVMNRLERRQRGGVDDRSYGAAVLQPVLERVGAEQQRKRHRDGAQLVDRDMGDRRFRALRQNDSDAVSALHAECAQRIRQPVGVGLQRGIGIGGAVAAFVLAMQGDPR